MGSRRAVLDTAVRRARLRIFRVVGSLHLRDCWHGTTVYLFDTRYTEHIILIVSFNISQTSSQGGRPCTSFTPQFLMVCLPLFLVVFPRHSSLPVSWLEVNDSSIYPLVHLQSVSPWLPELRTLLLGGNKINSTVYEALQTIGGWQSLQTCDMSGNELTGSMEHSLVLYYCDGSGSTACEGNASSVAGALLRVLKLDGNSLTGKVAQTVGTWLRYSPFKCFLRTYLLCRSRLHKARLLVITIINNNACRTCLPERQLYLYTIGGNNREVCTYVRRGCRPQNVVSRMSVEQTYVFLALTPALLCRVRVTLLLVRKSGGVLRS